MERDYSIRVLQPHHHIYHHYVYWINYITMSNRKDLKAFVRYDATGRVIAGSLILQRTKPKVGDWQEIDAYECCLPSTTTIAPTTTSTTTTAR
jgi:hypothetical protein